MNSLFIENIVNLYGDLGKAWLERLPVIIKKLQSRWHLRDICFVDNMTFNFVAKAITDARENVILKIGYDRKTIVDEAQALRYFNGEGSVFLIADDEEYNALLLQQALPGTTLKSLKLTQSDSILNHYAGVLKKLHSKRLTNGNYPHISDWLIAIDKASTDKFPAHVLAKAMQIKNKLLNTANTQLLLHGDLHLDNILQNDLQWIAIDPKGVIGDPEFEIFAFDFMQYDEIENSADMVSVLDVYAKRIAEKTELDVERIKDWAFVRLVLSAAWSIEDNSDPSWAITLASKLM